MKLSLRPYQVEAIDAVFSEYENGINRQLISLSTGLGKTFIAGNVIQQLPSRLNCEGRVLWLTHEENLIDQSAIAVMKVLFPEHAAIIELIVGEAGGIVNFMTANHNLFGDPDCAATFHLLKKELGVIKQKLFTVQPKFVVASVQTIINRLDKIPSDHFDMIICDEAHLFMSRTFSTVLNYFQPKIRLGLSVGPESYVELKGGIFKNGFVGSIEDAWKVVEGNFPIQVVDEYEIIKLKDVYSRGWENNKFQWKPVKTFIRHICDKKCTELTVGGDKLLLTNDHSVYTIKKEKELKLSESKSEDLCIKDVTLYETGYENEGDEDIEVAPLLFKLRVSSRIHVHVNLSGISHETFKTNGIGYKDKWQYLNIGKYGHYLPLHLYLKMKHILPVPELIYCEGSAGGWIKPFIKLSDWAYFIGFFYGDGWFTEDRMSFAVEDKMVPHIESMIDFLPNVNLNYKTRPAHGKSKEIRISNVLFVAILKYFIDNKKCHEKKIHPSFILEWTKQKRTELIHGLIDSDGSVSERPGNKKRVYYSTTSLSLAKTLNSLLRSIGVQGSIHHRKFYPNSGGITNGKKINGNRQSYSVNWSYFSMIGENHSHKGKRISFDHKKLDFNEAPIKKITSAIAPEYVYDFEMEGHPSFVANGVLVHNTATPFRLDGLSLGDLFDKIVITKDIKFGIDNGYLCELEAIWLKTNINLDDVHTIGGDFNQKELRIVDCDERNNQIVDKWIEVADGRPTIAFCIDVEHARNLTQAFVDRGVSASFVVADEKVCPDRKQRMRDFKAGKVTVMMNVQILTAGFDYPDVGCIVCANPTKSKAKFLQQIGRGTRKKTQAFIDRFGKSNCIIIDVTDNSQKHSLINTETLDKSKRFEEKIFMGAERKASLIEQRDKRSLEHNQLKTERYNLLSLPHIVVVNNDKRDPSPAMIGFLKGLGLYVEGNHYTFGQVSELISNSPASAAEIRYAAANGYDVSNGMSKATAEKVRKEVTIKLGKEALAVDPRFKNSPFIGLK